MGTFYGILESVTGPTRPQKEACRERCIPLSPQARLLGEKAQHFRVSSQSPPVLFFPLPERVGGLRPAAFSYTSRCCGPGTGAGLNRWLLGPLAAGLGAEGGPWIHSRVAASAGKATRLGSPETASCCQGPGLPTGLLGALPERLVPENRSFRLSKARVVFCRSEYSRSPRARGPDPDIAPQWEKSIKEFAAVFKSQVSYDIIYRK